MLKFLPVFLSFVLFFDLFFFSMHPYSIFLKYASRQAVVFFSHLTKLTKRLLFDTLLQLIISILIVVLQHGWLLDVILQMKTPILYIL